MSSKVDICNLALIQLGNATIESIDQPEKSEEVICSIWYDIIRKQALIDIKPNFANGRKSLPKLAESPAFGYSNQYSIPNDCLFVYGINEANLKSEIEYTLESNAIQTDYISNTDDTLPIRYLKDEKDTAKFSSDFVLYLALSLATEFAYSINKDSNLKQKLEVKKMMMRDKLTNRQKQENRIVLIDKKRYLGSRSSGISYSSMGKK